MSDKPNIFQRYDYYTTLVDDKGRPREVKVTDLSDADFRRWLMWKLPRLVRRGPREEPPVAKPKDEKKTSKKKTKKKTQTPAPTAKKEGP